MPRQVEQGSLFPDLVPHKRLVFRSAALRNRIIASLQQLPAVRMYDSAVSDDRLSTAA